MKNYDELFTLPGPVKTPPSNASRRSLQVRILDLDGALKNQTRLHELYKPQVFNGQKVKTIRTVSGH